VASVKIATALGILALLATTALAGDNPNCKVFVDFDPPHKVHRIDPVPYTTVDAYFGVTGVSRFVGLSVRVAVDHGALLTVAYNAFCPGGIPIIIDDPEEGMVFSCPDCIDGPEYYFLIMNFLYVGGDGDIIIADHPLYPREVYDCQSPPGVDYYCVWRHGGVWKAPEPGDPDCEPTAVENESWGTLKALYR
jgi:hypothetical protein